jgi:hypothetical protein
MEARRRLQPASTLVRKADDKAREQPENAEAAIHLFQPHDGANRFGVNPHA